MPLAEVEPRADIPPGTYEVTLTNVQPDVITPRMGRDAGKEVNVYRWLLQDEDGNDLDFLTRRDPTSEKSNMFKAMVAFNVPRSEMMTVEVGDIVGKRCLATVSINDQGYAQVDSLTPMPVRRRPAAVDPGDSGESVDPVVAAAEAEANIDDLPF